MHKTESIGQINTNNQTNRKVMQSIIIRLFSVVVDLTLLSTLTQANITVNNLADSGPGSLRQAITDATSGETINFSVTGTISLTSLELAVDKDLAIAGPGVTNLTVSGSDARRVFNIATGVVVISGLTISNGKTASSTYGETASSGGLVINTGNLTIDRCKLAHGTARTNGGGVYNGGQLTMSNSTIMDCHAEMIGGAICDFGSAGRVTNISTSTISGNGAYQGSGVHIGYGTCAITNCTISGNIGGYAGAALMNQGAMTVAASTICDNTSGKWGAGIACFWGKTTIVRNCIVARNFAGGVSSDVYSFGYTLTSQDHNLIQNTDGCTITGVTTNNIYGKDPSMGPLADNGGATLTHALRFDSPAVDAGNSAGLSTDQRGFPRPIDSPDVANAVGGDGSDMGAYEVNPSTQMSIYTAVEVEFGTTLGRTYRVESSTDMVTWSQVEAGIVGTGGPLTRLYTTRAIPKRFFQAVQE